MRFPRVFLLLAEQVETEQPALVLRVGALELGRGDLAALDQAGEAQHLAQLALQVQAVALGGDHVDIALAGGQDLAESAHVKIVHIDAIHSK